MWNPVNKTDDESCAPDLDTKKEEKGVDDLCVCVWAFDRIAYSWHGGWKHVSGITFITALTLLYY